MKFFKHSLAGLALALAAAGAAHAAPTISYGALPGAGTYYGSGNVDANWTVCQENGIILGLGFKDRATFALLDGSTGTYYVDLGTYAGGNGKQHLSYQFSAEGAAGTVYSLCVDHDPTAGVSATCVNPATYWNDNYHAAGSPATTLQNSENVGFADTPGGAFNPAQFGLYTFTLSAFTANGALLDSVSALVQVG